MVQSGQDANFSDRLLFSLWFVKFAPILLLDGDAFTAWPMDALFDYGVGPVTNLLAKMIRVQLTAVRSRELFTC